jgi:hypothetical protein
MTLSREDARTRLQLHLEQESYYLATTLLSNRLLRHGYAATAELFKEVGGFEQAAGIWQACLTAIQGTPEGDIIANVLHSPYSCHMLSDLCDGGTNVTYTIGLWHNFWHPEIICVGLPATVARLQINLYAERIADGCPPPLNEPISGGAIATNQVQFKICSDEAKAQFLPKATWFNSGQNFSAIQMIWQDQQQRWPWEEGFSAIEPQPLLLR